MTSSPIRLLGRPEVAHYVRGWPRVGDLGVVAEDGPPVGAAWLRLLPEHDRGYGFVDAKTPELSIGVVPTHRGRGIGSLLLEALVGSACEQRHEALSLSVEPDNPRNLSTSVGQLISAITERSPRSRWVG